MICQVDQFLATKNVTESGWTISKRERQQVPVLKHHSKQQQEWQQA